ncbi:Uncharacterised protein [Mycobacterium tuberculosis]|uniref:Uncharacterized protein n=1 Tax=Mycobacterium tuberculosis TaxID=1773 RepID=A0A654U067_MYCTX|nr:Uncharacterised protein [Mycobacterium tuberculosis]CKR21311.1 Uncharacterised protein [Mycobacterium tuberculosis]CKT38859.1 Uncharacterised protein [Mycobacterium tuberculosis]CKU43466.1 Uncharacterised protein [Mycobacterium tuberculosis]
MGVIQPERVSYTSTRSCSGRSTSARAVPIAPAPVIRIAALESMPAVRSNAVCVTRAAMIGDSYRSFADERAMLMTGNPSAQPTILA